MKNAVMVKAFLVNADLRGANLQNVNFTGANLQKAVLDDANLQNADFTLADLRRIMPYTKEQFCKVRSFSLTTMDNGLRNMIEKFCLHLLEKPKEKTDKTN